MYIIGYYIYIQHERDFILRVMLCHRYVVLGIKFLIDTRVIDLSMVIGSGSSISFDDMGNIKYNNRLIVNIRLFIFCHSITKLIIIKIILSDERF